ncbi:hypothetical protein HD806DRAFT_537099 [Xylariaceae sp. AK1471]|nr:hypothetical protein HD806DRAFT_537099 [Xylariaceae sp. AK1471]
MSEGVKDAFSDIEEGFGNAYPANIADYALSVYLGHSLFTLWRETPWLLGLARPFFYRTTPPFTPQGMGHELCIETLGLEPGKAAAIARRTASFKTSLQKYATARACGIWELEEVAKGEMSRYGNHLPTLVFIDVAIGTYPNPPVDDKWFPDFVGSRHRHLYEELNGPYQR